MTYWCVLRRVAGWVAGGMGLLLIVIVDHYVGLLDGLGMGVAGIIIDS